MEFICRDCRAKMYAEGGVWDETIPVKVIPCKCITDELTLHTAELDLLITQQGEKLRAQSREIANLKAEAQVNHKGCQTILPKLVLSNLITPTEANLFFSQLRIQPWNYCWQFIGYTKDGIPTVNVGGKDYSARNVAMHLHTSIPIEHISMPPTCELRDCCNPNHCQHLVEN